MSQPKQTVDYSQIALEARKKTLELIFKAQTSHVGSCLSAIDLMAVLFEKADPQKDEVILSAGWKAAAWYYFLYKKGIITEEELNSFCQKIECSDCKCGCIFKGSFGPLDVTNCPRHAIYCKYSKCKRKGRSQSSYCGYHKKYGCQKCNGTGQIQSKFIGLVEPQNCIECNGTGSDYPELRYAIDNGRTLCQSCHLKVTRKYDL